MIYIGLLYQTQPKCRFLKHFHEDPPAPLKLSWVTKSYTASQIEASVEDTKTICYSFTNLSYPVSQNLIQLRKLKLSCFTKSDTASQIESSVEETKKICYSFTNLSYPVSQNLIQLHKLRGPGGLHENFSKNRLFGRFLQRRSISIRCFWSNEKILFLAEVITGQRSAPMFNSIVCPEKRTSKPIFSYSF